MFVIDQIRKTIKGGIKSGGATRPIEILVRDCQSNPNRAAEVTVQLIKSDQVGARQDARQQHDPRDYFGQQLALLMTRRRLPGPLIDRGCFPISFQINTRPEHHPLFWTAVLSDLQYRQ